MVKKGQTGKKTKFWVRDDIQINVQNFKTIFDLNIIFISKSDRMNWGLIWLCECELLVSLSAALKSIYYLIYLKSAVSMTEIHLFA